MDTGLVIFATAAAAATAALARINKTHSGDPLGSSDQCLASIDGQPTRDIAGKGTDVDVPPVPAARLRAPSGAGTALVPQDERVAFPAAGGPSRAHKAWPVPPPLSSWHADKGMPVERVPVDEETHALPYEERPAGPPSEARPARPRVDSASRSATGLEMGDEALLLGEKPTGGLLEWAKQALHLGGREAGGPPVDPTTGALLPSPSMQAAARNAEYEAREAAKARAIAEQALAASASSLAAVHPYQAAAAEDQARSAAASAQSAALAEEARARATAARREAAMEAQLQEAGRKKLLEADRAMKTTAAHEEKARAAERSLHALQLQEAEAASARAGEALRSALAAKARAEGLLTEEARATAAATAKAAAEAAVLAEKARVANTLRAASKPLAEQAQAAAAAFSDVVKRAEALEREAQAQATRVAAVQAEESAHAKTLKEAEGERARAETARVRAEAAAASAAEAMAAARKWFAAAPTGRVVVKGEADGEAQIVPAPSGPSVEATARSHVEVRQAAGEGSGTEEAVPVPPPVIAPVGGDPNAVHVELSEGAPPKRPWGELPAGTWGV